MSEAANRGKGGGRGEAPKKPSGGGFWSNLFDGFVQGLTGAAAPARGAPVEEERKEAGEEIQYRTTDGASGRPPMQRIDQQRQHIARAIDTRGANGGAARIPQGGGAPLPTNVRQRMEPRLGADLSQVKIHTGGESHEAATALGARAFTVGGDVHFGAGEFAPGTKEGDRLLAHELTHTVQGQRSGVQRKEDAHGDKAHGDKAHGDAAHEHDVSTPDQPAEKEADAVGDHVAEDLHGGDKKAKPAGAGKEKAPAIGAKLSGRKIFRTATPGKPPGATPPPPGPGNAGAAPKTPPVPKVPFPTAIAGGKAQIGANGNKLEIQAEGGKIVTKMAEATRRVTDAKFPEAVQELTSAGVTVDNAEKALSSITVEEGKVPRTEVQKIEAQGNIAGQALLDVRKKFRVATLSEIGMGTKTVQPPWTTKLLYRKNKLGNKEFLAQYAEQLSKHEAKANTMTVDQWMTNLQVQELETKDHFEKAEESTKQAMVTELKERIMEADRRMKGSSAEFEKAMELKKALDKAAAEAEKAPKDTGKRDAAKAATTAFMTNPYVVKNFTARIATPRQEDYFRSDHLKGLQQIINEEQDKWKAAGDKKLGGTILHLPDQVAGGPGFLPTYGSKIPEPPTDPKAPAKEWNEYIDWLKEYIGSARVNSAIGASWPQAAAKVKEQADQFFATGGVTKAAYPVYKVNLKLDSGPNNDSR